MSDLTSIILAAGQGKRMKSKYPKVLHPILGKPMLQYVIDSAKKVGSDSIIVVVGFGGEKVIDTIGCDQVEFVWQKEQLGTGHAVMMAQDLLKECTGDLLVLYGDTPLLSEQTLRKLVDLKRSNKAKASVLTLAMADPKGYGRIIRSENGEIKAIVEDKDATLEEKQISEVNTGVYCFEITSLLEALAELTPNNAQGEYYLTDVIKIMAGKGEKIVGLLSETVDETMGPNDRIQLAATESFLKQSVNNYWMREGVTIEDPLFTYIGTEVEIGADTIIHPGTFLSGKTRIGQGCEIGPHTRIVDSEIGDFTTVQFSQILNAKLGDHNTVGPFAYIRPGTVSSSKVKFGDFVEAKNVIIGSGSKVPHLTYLGDTEVGTGVNIGAGTITCNYDGVYKHKTVIEDNVFVGSNSNLVAPVKIGNGATIGAGSTITKDVPEKALAIARSKQEHRLGWRSPREREKS